MNYLEFTVGMTRALAWPLSFVFVFIVLREPLKKAIGRMRTLRHGDMELAFENELEDVSRAAAEGGITIFRPLPPSAFSGDDPFNPLPADPFAPSQEADGFAQADPKPKSGLSDPRQEVMRTWDVIEHELARIASEAGASGNSLKERLATLREKNAMRDQEIDIIEDLGRMRNKAAHDLESKISREDAKRFMMIAASMTERLSQVSLAK